MEDPFLACDEETGLNKIVKNAFVLSAQLVQIILPRLQGTGAPPLDPVPQTTRPSEEMIGL